MECKVSGCEAKARSRYMCERHYAKWQRHGNPTAGYTRQSTAADTASKLGISYRQLDHWVTKGYLHPIPRLTPGGRRVWPATELRVAELMGSLTNAGIPPKVSARIARSLIDEGETTLAPGIAISLREEG